LPFGGGRGEKGRAEGRGDEEKKGVMEEKGVTPPVTKVPYHKTKGTGAYTMTGLC